LREGVPHQGAVAMRVVGCLFGKTASATSPRLTSRPAGKRQGHLLGGVAVRAEGCRSAGEDVGPARHGLHDGDALHPQVFQQRLVRIEAV